jgi:hypothetical protein
MFNGRMHAQPPGMRTLWMTATVIALVAGCGAVSREQWVYAKPGVAETQRQQDEQACRAQAVGTLEDKVPTFSQTMNREAFNDCMRGRGYDVSVRPDAVRY